jgi:hypothetical protein
MVNGVRLRLLSLRGSWVQIPSPAPLWISKLNYDSGFWNTVKEV